MGAIEFDKAVERLKDTGLDVRRNINRFGISNSKKHLEDGLKYFLENPKWLKEYDDISDWL